MDRVHIDKKWFYITEENQSYYMLPDETPSHRQPKSKRFVTKAIFLAAVAQPRFDTQKSNCSMVKLAFGDS